MALDGARGQGARHSPARTKSESAGRRAPDRAAPANGTSTSDALEEFAAVLAKMAQAEGRPGRPQDLEDPPSGIETPPEASQATDPGDAVPLASPIGTYRYGVTDLDGRPVTYAVVSPPEGGRVHDNGDGTFDFDPGSDFQDLAAGETREVGFTYQAVDGTGAAATATITVVVTGAGDGLAAAGGGAVEEDALREAGGIETIHIDGVSGAPGVGGWTIALNKGEIIETNVDNLVLSDDAVGVIILGSDTGEIYFEGIDRIEW